MGGWVHRVAVEDEAAAHAYIAARVESLLTPHKILEAMYTPACHMQELAYPIHHQMQKCALMGVD